jgi:hypothetical protein
VDDEAWVERLRRAVSEGMVAAPAADDGAVDPGPAPGPVTDPATEVPDPTDALVGALRDLERKVAVLDIRLRQMHEARDALVADVADAVVDRLADRVSNPAADEDPAAETWSASEWAWLRRWRRSPLSG